MQVILVRHGSKQKNFTNNSAKEHYAHLSNTGRMEAINTGLFLSKKKFDKVFASPLPRTRETAGLILRNNVQSTIHYDSRLKEQFVTNSDFERDKFDKIIEQRNQDYSFAILGCESISKVIQRYDSFMSELASLQLETILIVSHACVMQYWLKDKLKVKTNLDPCSITSLEWQDGSWICHSANYTDHLDPA
jgi:2,3-bisphosphoglycerate-dependent phosphoglycerate mutase